MTTRMGLFSVSAIFMALIQLGIARPQNTLSVSDLILTQGIQVRPEDEVTLRDLTSDVLNEVNAFNHPGADASSYTDDVTLQFRGDVSSVGLGASPSLLDIQGQPPVLSVDTNGPDDVQLHISGSPSVGFDAALSNLGAYEDPSVLSVGAPGFDVSLSNTDTFDDPTLFSVGTPGFDVSLSNTDTFDDPTLLSVGTPGFDVSLSNTNTFDDPTLLSVGTPGFDVSLSNTNTFDDPTLLSVGTPGFDVSLSNINTFDDPTLHSVGTPGFDVSLSNINTFDDPTLHSVGTPGFDVSLSNTGTFDDPTVLSVGTPGFGDTQISFQDPAYGDRISDPTLDITLDTTYPATSETTFPELTVDSQDPTLVLSSGSGISDVPIYSQNVPSDAGVPVPTSDFSANVDVNQEPIPFGGIPTVDFKANIDVKNQEPIPFSGLPSLDFNANIDMKNQEPIPFGGLPTVDFNANIGVNQEPIPFSGLNTPSFNLDINVDNTPDQITQGDNLGQYDGSSTKTSISSSADLNPDLIRILSTNGQSQRSLGNGNRMGFAQRNNKEPLLQLVLQGLLGNKQQSPILGSIKGSLGQILSPIKGSLGISHQNDPLKQIFNLLTLGLFENNQGTNPIKGLISTVLGLLGGGQRPASLHGGQGVARQGFAGADPATLDILSKIGLNAAALGSLTQTANAGLDDIARESSARASIAQSEIQYLAEQKLEQKLENLQEAGRTVGNIGINSYFSLMDKRDILADLMAGVVTNLGTFFSSQVGNTFDKLGNTADTVGRFVNDLKVGALNSAIAKGEATRHLVNGTLSTVGTAFKGLTRVTQEAIEDKIKSITSLKSRRKF